MVEDAIQIEISKILMASSGRIGRLFAVLQFSIRRLESF